MRPPRVMKHTSMLSGFVAVRSPSRAAWPSHVGLRQRADGEQRRGELVGLEDGQHVRLVLGGVGPPTELGRTARAGRAARVMARGEGVEAHRVGPLVQPAPLDAAVALDARVRRAARGVARDVGLHDPGVELLGEVEHVVRQVELRGDPTGVLDVGHRAAAGVAGATPELQCHAGDVVPLVAQQRGRDRRVDAAAHRHEHLHVCRPTPSAHAAVHAAARSRATAAGTRASARSTSASVDA